MLQVLLTGPAYGLEIAKNLSLATGGRFRLTAGSLYPILRKLEAEHLIGALETAEAGPPKWRRRYALTLGGAVLARRERRLLMAIMQQPLPKGR